MLSENWAIVGAVINTIGGLSYLWDTWRLKNAPNRATWIIWALAPFIILAAQAESRVGTQALFTFSAGFTLLLVFLASFRNKKSYCKLKSLDYVCAGLSILGLILWRAADNANIAIVFSIFADALASLPTVIKSYTNPETESGPPFLWNIVGVSLTLLTFEDLSFVSVGFTAYYFILVITLFVLIQFKVGPRVRSRLE
jgi:hypothetical protein